MALTTLLCAGCVSRPWYDEPPAIPVPLEPAAASIVVNQAATRFVWRASENTEHYEFHIFNRVNSDINRYYLNEIDPDEVCYQSLCEITLEVSLPVVKGHAWRVRASNIAGKSAWTRIEFEAAN